MKACQWILENRVLSFSNMSSTSSFHLIVIGGVPSSASGRGDCVLVNIIIIIMHTQSTVSPCGVRFTITRYTPIETHVSMKKRTVSMPVSSEPVKTVTLPVESRLCEYVEGILGNY